MTGGSSLTLSQGGVYLAKLNPAKKGEVGKVRPVIVLTNQTILEAEPPIIFICPLSSQSQKQFQHCHIDIPPRDSLKKNSYAMVEHCRAIANHWITTNRLAQLQSHEIDNIIARLNLIIDHSV